MEAVKKEVIKSFDVDIVVPWVDGSDKEWQAVRAQYSKEEEAASENGENRYRDWGLMPLWFEGIFKYAPWVRTIHFVTWGHLPEGVDFSDPRIHIVRHEDYLPDYAMPTFNSSAIEINFHRIEGLAEHYIEFNDDVFFCRETKKSDFFDLRTGLPKQPFEEIPVRFKGAGNWLQLTANDMSVINQHFSKRGISFFRYPGLYLSSKYPMKDNVRTLAMRLLFPEYYTGFKNHHTCVPLLKSTLEKVWEKEPDMLREVASHKFRDAKDINVWLFQWWQLASGAFRPKRNDAIYFNANGKTVDMICDCIRNKKAAMICINDQDSGEDTEKIAKKIKEAMEETLRK